MSDLNRWGLNGFEDLHHVPRSLIISKASDGTRRLVTDEWDLQRFFWVLDYEDGTVRQQYEKIGDQIYRTLFGRLPSFGVHLLRVVDIFNLNGPPILKMFVPQGAEVDILDNCEMDVNLQKIKRIHTFGWRHWNGEPGEYFHLDPSTNPPRFKTTRNRIS